MFLETIFSKPGVLTSIISVISVILSITLTSLLNKFISVVGLLRGKPLDTLVILTSTGVLLSTIFFLKSDIFFLSASFARVNKAAAL